MIDAAAHLGLARMVAQRMRSQWAAVLAPEDAEGWAMVGLCKAARRYDPARGLAFSTYAGYRIAGEIRDAIRRELGDPRRTLRPRPISLDAPRLTADGERYTLAERLVEPSDPLGAWMEACDRRAERQAQRQRLAATIATLPARPRTIFGLLARGCSQTEAARRLGLNEGSVSWLRARWQPYLVARLRGEQATPPRTLSGRARGSETGSAGLRRLCTATPAAAAIE